MRCVTTAGSSALELYDVDSPRQGIVHVIAPELGIALPGCHAGLRRQPYRDERRARRARLGHRHHRGDARDGGAGADAAQAEADADHRFAARPQEGVFSKDLILHFIGRHGVAVGAGFAVEYAGRGNPRHGGRGAHDRSATCRSSSAPAWASWRPTTRPSNTSAGRPFAPTGAAVGAGSRALAHARLRCERHFERELEIDCSAVRPQITWGTSPQDLVSDRRAAARPIQRSRITERRESMTRALRLHGSRARAPLWKASRSTTRSSARAPTAACPISKPPPAWCAAARWHAGVTALVVPGSMQVKAAAEAAGLDKVFVDGRLRMAQRRLLDVRHQQRRHRRARQARDLDHQPQFRASAGAAEPHAPGEPGDRSRPRRSRAASSMSASCCVRG